MIEVQSLTKEYGRFRAVDDLSFRVAPGEVLGFLGPNGAGKTTTMRIVAGLPAADGGPRAGLRLRHRDASRRRRNAASAICPKAPRAIPR